MVPQNCTTIAVKLQRDDKFGSKLRKHLKAMKLKKTPLCNLCYQTSSNHSGYQKVIRNAEAEESLEDKGNTFKWGKQQLL